MIGAILDLSMVPQRIVSGAEEHLLDKKCNALCRLFEETGDIQNGVIIHSDLLLEYLKKNYPNLYFVSSTTKVLTNFQDL